MVATPIISLRPIPWRGRAVIPSASLIISLATIFLIIVAASIFPDRRDRGRLPYRDGASPVRPVSSVRRHGNPRADTSTITQLQPPGRFYW
jgi:hypothetical protein